MDQAENLDENTLEDAFAEEGIEIEEDDDKTVGGEGDESLEDGDGENFMGVVTDEDDDGGDVIVDSYDDPEAEI